ncbi:MAG TPA: hypothetical protein VM261_22685 [Kofleriaceae bacterium]|nr:hypothetical protein [Kofleriaceae bacterium]
MKRIILAVLALFLVAGCKKTECPTCEKCPPAATPTPTPCPDENCSLELEENSKTTLSPAWRLVEENGKFVLTTTLEDKRVIAVPLSATTPLFIDGKQTTGEQLLIGPGGGCPCRLLQCMPYCRPIGSVLSPPQPTPPQ